jgi:hypothetical protein
MYHHFEQEIFGEFLVSLPGKIKMPFALVKEQVPVLEVTGVIDRNCDLGPI